MLSNSKLLAGAAAFAAITFSTGILAADAKGALYGDFRMGFTHIDQSLGGVPDEDFHDNGSYFGFKASTSAGGVTAFGKYERHLDTDDSLNFITGNGTSTTTLATGGTDYVREAYAGVSSAWGTLSFGQMETSYSQTARRYDPFYNTGVSDIFGGFLVSGFGGSHGGSPLSLPIFSSAYVNNQVAYVSPSFFGMSVNAGYFADEGAGPADDPDYAIGADFSMASIHAGVQHIKIRSGIAPSSVANFLIGGTAIDATVVSVGYSAQRFGVGLVGERLEGPGLPVDSAQLSGWFGILPGTRIAALVSYNNQSDEGRSVNLGVFHDVVDNFTVHLAAKSYDGKYGDPDEQAVTIGASYKFDLGFGK